MFDNPAAEHNFIEIVYNAKRNGNLKKIDTKYFVVDLFKDDKMHLTFKDLTLLKKFNLYVNKTTGRLPANYGLTPYNKLTADARRLVDEYEGKSSYDELHANYNAYDVKPFKTYWDNFIKSNSLLVDAVKLSNAAADK